MHSMMTSMQMALKHNSKGGIKESVADSRKVAGSPLGSVPRLLKAEKVLPGSSLLIQKITSQTQ